jgi:FlaA1/EpsC-like NDP-sugar epimerase
MKKFFSVCTNVTIGSAILVVLLAIITFICGSAVCGMLVIAGAIFFSFLFIVLRQIWWLITKTGDYASTKDKKG